MSLDQTTESIAHFIGLFHLSEEETRLRKEYFEFKMKGKEVVSNDLAFAPVETKAPYKVSEFDAQSRFKALPEPLPPADGVMPSLSGRLAEPYSADVEAPILPDPLQGGSLSQAMGGMTILPYVPIPSSVVTVTLQSIFLSDNDIFGDIELAGFQDLAGYHSMLDAGIETAEALQPWSSDNLVTEFLADPQSALPFIDMLNAIEAPQDAGVKVNIATGEETQGTYVNGTLVEQAPELEDQLPAFIKAKRDKQLDDEDEDQLAGFENDEGIHSRDNDAFATVINSEHNVSTGANETHNQVAIQTSWIDAGVIAVAGDVITLDAISQINVMFDQDRFESVIWNDPSAPSQAYNIAKMQAESREIPSGVQIEAAASSGLPSSWSVLRYEGDVTVTNFVKQHTFVTDTDRLELTFTANSTSIVTGENLTYNLVQTGEFGFGYDLIFVGGTMLSLNLISQTNVLMDSDYFSGDGLGLAALSGQDNLLRNEAEIRKDGIDTQVDMLEEFKTALDNLKQGAGDLADSVAQSEFFQGLDQLRVLYIEGNLTQMNIVDQVNYLGDQDQVYMAMDAVSSALDDVPVAITTGSNLMTNTANILSTGYNSNVMTDGEYYTAALLHQAELIETDANPVGVGMSALASEAVAFLADDMVTEQAAATLDSANFNNDAHSGGVAFDVMQTMTG